MSEEAWVAIVVALIPIVGAGVGYLIKYLVDFRKENREDHNVVMEAINELKTDVREVKGDLHNHVQWHLRRKK